MDLLSVVSTRPEICLIVPEFRIYYIVNSVQKYRNYSNLKLLLINADGQKWPKVCNLSLVIINAGRKFGVFYFPLI